MLDDLKPNSFTFVICKKSPLNLQKHNLHPSNHGDMTSGSWTNGSQWKWCNRS